ncbi:MAG TPA: hypothetical protein VFS18_04240 [Actinomycetota bacterium]|nr:hypothetical protein [Actinomycetota bacterium]
MTVQRSQRHLSYVLAVVLAMALVVVGGPAGATAGEERQRISSISITSDKDFNPANGVRSGTGTKGDPFVISNWDTSSLSIRDTGAWVVIKNNTIDTARLNWNGRHVTVVNNTIGDLRVNENIPRTGDATSGLIARNDFGTVGQLRHFDGIFEKNVVGDPSDLALPFFQQQAVLFDGFNGARFRDNVLYGYLDIRLHGHHHGSGFDETSHHHGTENAHHGGAMDSMDHSQRYHEVTVTGNEIHSTGPWALRYNDRAHSANDRTANSEENPELDKPHMHYTRVHLNDNLLLGSGLAVEIFNSKDELHKEIGHGSLEISGNTVKLERDTDDSFNNKNGIWISEVQVATLRLRDNVVLGAVSQLDNDVFGSADAGIRLDRISAGRIKLAGNSVADFTYGIAASQMDEKVHWTIARLKAERVDYPVYYDNSVKNRPRQNP